MAPARHLTGGAWRCRVGHTWAGHTPADPKPKPKLASLPRGKGKCRDCRDEGIASDRPAPHPGPRCQSHHNDRRRALRLRRSENHVQRTYGLTPEQYDKQLAFQGGKCAICRRATGASKRLAVDHSHAHCIGAKGCPLCARALVCSICNDVLAHFRDSAETFDRAAGYLRDWPTRQSGVVPRDPHVL